MAKPILDILTGKLPERIPIWLMRQAGRYLPEYRKLRAEAGSFLDLCLTPKLATEITLQPIKRFNFDAAILFADILLIPHALGQKLEFRQGEGPVLEKLEDQKSLNWLKYDEQKLEPVFETVNQVSGLLPAETSLIGFCGGLWTVAAYMIDGTSRGKFAQAKLWVEEKPLVLDKLIQLLLNASENYICRQIEAGAEVIQIFESWADLLPGKEFDRWILKPTLELVARVKLKHPHIPFIGFPRNVGKRYQDYARKSGVDAVSIDQNVSLDDARALQNIRPLQGNLDPALLVKGGEEMQRAALDILEKLGPRHIFNLGHGVVPETPLEHVEQLVKIVREYKR